MFRGKKKYRTDGYIFGKLKKKSGYDWRGYQKTEFSWTPFVDAPLLFLERVFEFITWAENFIKVLRNRVDFSYKVLEHLDLFFENKWLQKTFYRTWAWAIFQKSSHKVSASLRRCLISLWATNIEDKYIVNYRIFLLFSTQFRNIKFVWIYIFVCYI